MKRMRVFIIGLLAGALLATTGTSFASAIIEKVTATIRGDFAVELDGKKVELKNPPLVYDGSTYVPLRELSGIFGAGVNWNNSTQTVELTRNQIEKGDSSVTQAIYLNGRDIVELLGKKYPDKEKDISLSPEGLLKLEDKEYQLQYSKENAGFLITPLLEAGIIESSDL